jgi:hypothetical protein
VLHIGRSGNRLVGETCTSFVILHDLYDGRSGLQQDILGDLTITLISNRSPYRDAAKW